MSDVLRFDERVVIVTGASRGIGRELAGLYASRGAQVVVNGRTPDRVDAAVAEITAAGGEAHGVVGDVADASDAGALVAATVERYGRVDVVVNNAGLLNFVPFAEMTRQTLDEMLGVNLHGTFHVTQAAWPNMIERGYGRVIVTPSHGIFGAPQSAHYALSKAAVVGLMRALSIEGREHGINVNAVLPFAVTEMMIGAMTDGAAIVEGGAEDLAAAAEYLQPGLVTPAAAWLTHETCRVTGEILTAGGGRIARVFLAETTGFHDFALSPELVRDNWDAVCREGGYTVPGDHVASLSKVIDALKPPTNS